jgi:hypothetical protein
MGEFRIKPPKPDADAKTWQEFWDELMVIDAVDASPIENSLLGEIFEALYPSEVPPYSTNPFPEGSEQYLKYAANEFGKMIGAIPEPPPLHERGRTTRFSNGTMQTKQYDTQADDSFDRADRIDLEREREELRRIAAEEQAEQQQRPPRQRVSRPREH